MSTYDDWKLATPPEYEREEEAGAPAAASPRVHRCASYECWACGVCRVCEKEHQPFCDAVKHSMGEEDIKW